MWRKLRLEVLLVNQSESKNSTIEGKKEVVEKIY